MNYEQACLILGSISLILYLVAIMYRILKGEK